MGDYFLCAENWDIRALCTVSHLLHSNSFLSRCLSNIYVRPSHLYCITVPKEQKLGVQHRVPSFCPQFTFFPLSFNLGFLSYLTLQTLLFSLFCECQASKCATLKLCCSPLISNSFFPKSHLSYYVDQSVLNTEHCLSSALSIFSPALQAEKVVPLSE